MLAALACIAFVAQSSATASLAATSSRGSQATHARSLEAWLRVKLRAARKYRGTIRFFETHRSLMHSKQDRAAALAALARAKRKLARVTREAAYYRRLVRTRAMERRARALATASPSKAICDVFGRRYCSQAIAVAWCESRLSITAQNGQYLGLFQMGSNERRLYGHGSTALEQAVAAHRYFVRSGRDWSPWSCRFAVS